MEYLVLGLAWLLLPLPLAIVVGKCVNIGQRGVTASHAAVAAEPSTAAAPQPPDPVSAADQSASTDPGTPAVPTQRRPASPAHEPLGARPLG